MKSCQRVATGDGVARLVLELRGIRKLTSSERTDLEERLRQIFDMGDVSLALQDLGLCEVVLAAV